MKKGSLNIYFYRSYTLYVYEVTAMQRRKFKKEVLKVSGGNGFILFIKTPWYFWRGFNSKRRIFLSVLHIIYLYARVRVRG
jgi:hypothetical protein